MSLQTGFTQRPGSPQLSPPQHLCRQLQRRALRPRRPHFSSSSQSQTGQRAAAATGQAPVPATAAATATLLLLQRKGYSSLGVERLQTSPALHVPFSANLNVLPCRRAKENHHKHHREHRNEGYPRTVGPAPPLETRF